MFEGKSINDITEQDLQGLIGISSEEHNVDFKGDAYQVHEETLTRDLANELDQFTDEKRKKEKLHEKRREREKELNKELCKDISAFANGSGGWIVCGMKEKISIATELIGVKTSNIEKEINRLEQAARSGIDPYPFGIQFRAIILESINSIAIVIFIPRSYNAPHRVKETGKFHVRGSKGNRDMTMDELRYQFTFAQAISERIKAFRKQRVEAISNRDYEELPVLLNEGRHLVLHIIPFSAYEAGKIIDMSIFRSSNLPNWLLNHNFQYGRYNIDGYVTPLEKEEVTKPIIGYTQVFRNGIVECVKKIGSEDKYIRLKRMEYLMIELAKPALEIHRNLTKSPLVIMMSITNTKENILIPGGYDDYQSPFVIHLPLQRINLLIPEIVVEDYESEEANILRPLFDLLWNAAGYSRSFSYSSNGIWHTDRFFNKD